ncbi:MAG: hypothetical protein JSU63_14585 [Phycisphaerales bacterium]|nr:MAG: hypothetical protein JSU63_14585 [Phycisphaerales bacterium]
MWQYGRTERAAAVAAILAIALAMHLSPGQGDQAHAARDGSIPPSPRSDILSTVPARASAAFVVNGLGATDAKLTRLFSSLGVPFSPYTLAKGWLEIVTGIDEHGPAAVVVVPHESSSSTSHGLALVLPTNNRDELLAFLNPQPLDDGFVKVTLRGRESFAATMGGFTVLAADLHTAKSVVGAEKHLADKLSELQAKKWAAADVAMWIDPAAMKVEPPQAGTALSLRRLIDEGPWLKRFGSLQLLGSLEPEGVSLSFYAERKSDHADKPRRETERSLLSGLPDEPFVLAVGMTERATAESARALCDGYASLLAAAGILQPERSADLAQILDLGFRHVGTVALSVSILPDDTSGSGLGLAKVLQVTTSDRMFLDHIDAVLRFLESEPFADPRVDQAMKRLQHRRAVETSLGVSIDHLLLDLTDLEVVDTEAVEAFVGNEGILMRVGVVDDKHVVIALGGGLERFNAIVSAVRAGRAPISSDAGAMKSARGVTRARSIEAYFSLARGVRLINAAYAAWNKPPPFPEVAETDAPIALAIHSGGPAATQLDFFVPTGLIVAVKNVIVDKAAGEAKLGR